MQLAFTKMHGAGNDFVLIDNRDGRVPVDAALARRLADRHFGVGCDQVLVIAAPGTDEVDIDYRIFNADGSESGQCGNGIRCVTRWLADRGALSGTVLRARTITSVLRAELLADGSVRVDMGLPVFEPARIPLAAPARAEHYLLPGEEAIGPLAAVSMGNPHAVLAVSSVATADVAGIGPRVQASPLFPEGVNVGFMEVRSRSCIGLRVYERGAGETLACGTGACAAVVAGRMGGLLEDSVRVCLPGGELTVQWSGEGERVFMSGPATTVFEGRIAI